MHRLTVIAPAGASSGTRRLAGLLAVIAPLCLAACAVSPYGDEGGEAFGRTIRSALQAQSLPVSRNVPDGVTHGELEPALARLRASPASQGAASGGGVSQPRPMLP